VAQADWSGIWKEAFKPLRIGARILMRPWWVAESQAGTLPGDVILSLDPGMAFGTGLHPTTQLCALALADHVRPGMRVFDVGSGSGVLSILAAKLGASEVLAVDTDEEAVRVGAENVRSNDVADRVQVAAGTHNAPGAAFDIVVANILAGVIVKMLGSGLAARGRRFIFSGILEGQAAEVEAAARTAGLSLVERRQMLDWVCLLFGDTKDRIA
jgi:ribosomal protein L11 methyltransferase